MNIQCDKPVMVFKKDGQYGTMYSLGISRKKADGSYESGYISCKFKQDVQLENKTNIYIKSAWLSFYLKDKKTNPFIFVNEFTTVDNTIKESKEPTKIYTKEIQTDMFEDFGKENEVELDKLDLPF